MYFLHLILCIACTQRVLGECCDSMCQIPLFKLRQKFIRAIIVDFVSTVFSPPQAIPFVL